MMTSVLTLPEQALRRQLADKESTPDQIACLYGDKERVKAIGQLIYEWCKDGRCVARRVESSYPIHSPIAAFKVGGGSLRMPKPVAHHFTDFKIGPEDYANALQNGLTDLLPGTTPAVLAWLGKYGWKVKKAGVHAKPRANLRVGSRDDLIEEGKKAGWSNVISDITNASKTGLSAAAKAPGRTGWYLDLAIAWAYENGRAKKGKPLTPVSTWLGKAA